jgi:ATP-dependent DNA helicase RecQ
MLTAVTVIPQPRRKRAMQNHNGDLLPVLKQHFGFGSFKPLQEQIISDSLAGRDVFALLPTGGGKSLCFQLPALVRPGMTVVVSPLIALMKDQVDALEAAGIPATFVNSSLDPDEIHRRMRAVAAGRYRLLYAAPERVLLPNFLAALQGCDVGLIAIDEAHCISEWGHDFRPEYRQLGGLWEKFPQAGVMALTATATERVRADILQHLRQREPAVHVGSFNRENLTYRVVPKADGYAQLLTFLKARRDESGIVYCLARRTAETLAERLAADGIEARPYHAGLTAMERTRHQEAFIRDEVPVVCATIAFGMGINKPNVRFVVHYDLPRSVEGYYQETGRAGRDGLPSECLLLFTSGAMAASLMRRKTRSSGRLPGSSSTRWRDTRRARPAAGASSWTTLGRHTKRRTAAPATTASPQGRRSTGPPWPESSWPRFTAYGRKAASASA